MDNQEKIYGYARVSTREQNEDRQIIALREMGVPEENIYLDKLSGKADYEYSIAYSLDEIRPRYKWNESCQGSVPAAMRCFYESDDYESFIRNVFSLECDSDTGAV